MENEQDDKQFDATEQKLRRLREEGDIPRSAEVNSALMYLGFWAAVSLVGGIAVPGWLHMAGRVIGGDGWPHEEGESFADLAVQFSGYAVIAVLSGIALMGICLLLGLVAQRSLIFTSKKLLPDFKRVNLVRNAKQKFGKSGLVTFAISLGKVALVACCGWMLFSSLLVWLGNSDYMADLQWVSGIGMILRRAIYAAVGVSAVFAIVDFLWKRFEHRQRNRMTRKEMRDEHKESEGDPYMKSRRRQKGVDIAMNRMLSDVEKADVVIVNPTHYAVALEWKRGSGRAPVCLAKGVDGLAAKIRERAREHKVPIWSDPPCARALHAVVEIGDEIRTEHFAPVAAAIRFAEAMRKKMREGWDGFEGAASPSKGT